MFIKHNWIFFNYSRIAKIKILKFDLENLKLKILPANSGYLKCLSMYLPILIMVLFALFPIRIVLTLKFNSFSSWKSSLTFKYSQHFQNSPLHHTGVTALIFKSSINVTQR